MTIYSTAQNMVFTFTWYLYKFKDDHVLYINQAVGHMRSQAIACDSNRVMCVVLLA